MKLTPIEAQSALWLKLVDHMNESLEECRRKNDNASLTELETARLRGRIAAFKSFVGLGQPEPTNVAENGNE